MDDVKRRRMLLWPVLTAIVALSAVWLLRPASPNDLTDASRLQLLSLARRQLEALVLNSATVTLDDVDLPRDLRTPGSAFVTLRGPDGELRGCMIDRFDAHESLAENVLRNVAYAFSDDRFAPISPAELEETTIEISVLSEPTVLAFDSPEGLVRQLTPGVDGVILRTDDGVSTFLPYVWEELADPELFLSELCLKQGLPADRWRTVPYPTIETYRVDSFAEIPHD